MIDKKLSTEELQKLLEQDKAEHLENCRGEIEAILQKLFRIPVNYNN